MDISKQSVESNLGTTLTPRESEVVLGVVRGASMPGLASALGLSQPTVVTYLKRVYLKTSVHSREELTAKALGIWEDR